MKVKVTYEETPIGLSWTYDYRTPDGHRHRAYGLSFPNTERIARKVAEHFPGAEIEFAKGSVESAALSV